MGEATEFLLKMGALVLFIGGGMAVLFALLARDADSDEDE